MSDEKMILQLGPSVVDAINRLMPAYGEKSAEAVIARAIGLLQRVQPYLEDGTLLVVDPQAAPRHDLVELVFENAPSLIPN